MAVGDGLRGQGELPRRLRVDADGRFWGHSGIRVELPEGAEPPEGRRHTATLHGARYVTVPEVERLRRAMNAVLQAAADEARAAG